MFRINPAIKQNIPAKISYLSGFLTGSAVTLFATKIMSRPSMTAPVDEASDKLIQRVNNSI